MEILGATRGPGRQNRAVGAHVRIEPATAALIEVSPSDVGFLAHDLAPNERAWFAIDRRSDVVGGVRVDLQSGPTGLDVIGAHVVVDTLAVTEAEQRKGYGRSLMEFVEIWLSSQPALPQKISLGVETSNAPAIRLYESLGYVTPLKNGRSITFQSDGNECVVITKPTGGSPTDEGAGVTGDVKLA